MREPLTILYHGSPVALALLEPRPVRGVGPERDRLTAIYATDLRDFAIAFALAPPPGTGTLRTYLELLADYIADEKQRPEEHMVQLVAVFPERCRAHIASILPSERSS